MTYLVWFCLVLFCFVLFTAPSMIMGGGTDIVRYSDSSNKNKNSNGRRDRTTLCTLVHTAENAYFHEGKSGVIAGRILAHFENHNSGPINNGNDGGGGGDDNSNYSSDDLFPTATMEPSPTPEPALPAIEVEPPSYTGTEHKLTFTVNLINRDGFGTIKGYSWVQLSGPIDVMLKDSSTVNLTHLVAGEYSFQITVTASIIETISEVVNVTILPRDNSFPTIVAPHKDIDLETIANQEGKVLIQADESFDEEDQNENSYPLRFVHFYKFIVRDIQSYYILDLFLTFFLHFSVFIIFCIDSIGK